MKPCYPSQIRDPKFTPEEVSDLWAYAKTAYIDKGVTSLDHTIKGVATDLGLHPDWVARALTQPKAIRKVSNELYQKMALRRQVINDAKGYVRSLDTPLFKRAIETLLRAPFAIKVYGHGTVGMITHSGGRMFLPSQWNTYWSNFGRQWKLWTNKAYHEAAIQQLVRDPDFVMWKRAGAAIDPDRIYTDYGMYAKWAGRFGQAGSRGFDALKLYRLEANKAEWAKVPESIKSDPEASVEMMKSIAKMNNHATGVSDIGHGTLATGATRLLFAAKLEGSRWARMIGDPIKTAETFATWKTASAADRQIAITRVKHAAEFTAFYFASMLANQGILKAVGSNQSVNFTDPTKSDWLKFKAAGYNVALDGGLLAPVRFLGKIIAGDLLSNRTKWQQVKGTKFEQVGTDVAKYARGKASPAVGLGTDIATGADFMGRPLPFSNEKPRFKDQPKYSWGEYALSQGPIPLSGAIREIYDSFRQQGMSAMQITTFLRALAIATTESTGAHVSKDYSTEKKR